MRVDEENLTNPGTETAEGWSLKRIFQVELDDDEAGKSPIEVVDDAKDSSPDSVPDINDEYPGYEPAVVTSIEPEQNLEQPLVWHITVNYEQSNEQVRLNPEDPTDQEPIVRTRYEEKQVPQDFAYQPDGSDSPANPTKPIATSFGVELAEKPTFTRYNRVLEITINLHNYTDGQWNMYKNTVNWYGVQYLGFNLAAQTALMRNIKSTPKRDKQGRTYWQITFEILEDTEGHEYVAMDRGYKYLDSDDNKQEAESREPVNLDGTGHLAGSDGDGTPAKLRFILYYLWDWYLPLPRYF